MKYIANMAEGKITSRKLLYIIGLTSVFWFAMNVLLLIANNKYALDSLEKLALTSNEKADSHYMSHVNIQPLAPAYKRSFDLPWLKDEFWNKKTISSEISESAVLSQGADRPVYDISAKKNINPMKGEGGEASYLDTEAEKQYAEKIFANHSFNSVLSDKISLDRTMRDVRGDLCIEKHKTYPRKLPTASVIICFHNEAYSVLLRTVHSVLNRTPPDLLTDIILVDDKSEYENLKRPLDDHVAQLSKKIKIIRNAKRSGLIRSRINGADLSRGDVLIFLDSHCETTPGWAEPLLARIAEKSSNVVVPIIEVINADTLQYAAAANPDQRGGFSWDLFYKWKPIPLDEQHLRKSPIDVIRTPTMAGGLFAIDRKYFYDMGTYDEEMDIWGGENLEMSFRIWMCGGRIDIIPCSRVGHIFRKFTSPYKFPDGVEKTLSKNLNRLAEVWLDEYKELYYQKRPQSKGKDYGDISQRLALRNKLNCKSFKWYIENIYPDVQLPDLYPPARGEIKNPASSYCLDSMGDMKGNNVKKLGIFPCHGQGGNQNFVFSRKGEIVFDEEYCLDVSSSKPGVLIDIMKCHNFGGNQQWIHKINTGEIMHYPTRQCIDRGSNTNKSPQMQPCNGQTSQKWVFSHYNMTSFALISNK
ncbi:polypeptide N-acetylgalactosaminyltransferase 13 isoform X1 [Hydra vulgaris]|uniref:polypeptide N-acetylgalactosaminyltransferase 13 isoform X1 n=1 Tax=Hydra vulgaris TaxID=6087 RepID=UPI0002B4A757|nr:polypeptide N-acetylgalactosaminyltransferase 13 [Hydra vulgaris]